MKATQLLAVLKTGATVEFPSGYKVKGDPESQYIETYEHDQYTGLWGLNEDGAKECLREKKEMEADDAQYR